MMEMARPLLITSRRTIFGMVGSRNGFLGDTRLSRKSSEFWFFLVHPLFSFVLLLDGAFGLATANRVSFQNELNAEDSSLAFQLNAKT